MVSHCLGPGAALENMFVWVILAYSQTLGVYFGLLGGILGIKLTKYDF